MKNINKSKKEQIIKYKNNHFMKAFLHDYILRPSCYSCQFKYNNIPCDILIGDFWCIQKVIKSFDDDMGISEVIINTEKGKTLFDSCNSSLSIISVPIESMLQNALVKSAKIPQKRDQYFQLCKINSLEKTNSILGINKSWLMRNILHLKKEREKNTYSNLSIEFNDFYIKEKNSSILKETCCGCSSCSTICPVDAIEMKTDSEGFFYPFFNIDKCIGCKLCEKHCPIVNSKCISVNSEKQAIGFAAKCNNPKIRKESSSGGLFSVLATKILEQDGIVYGAALSIKNGYISTKHIRIKKKEELYKIQGSKYMQSEMGQTYEEIRNLLSQGFKVLFSGTACQIAGLKAFLKKDYINLITIAIICHGVPSSMIFNQYIKEITEQRNKTEIADIKFRDKTLGWRKYCMKIIYKNK